MLSSLTTIQDQSKQLCYALICSDLMPRVLLAGACQVAAQQVLVLQDCADDRQPISIKLFALPFLHIADAAFILPCT